MHYYYFCSYLKLKPKAKDFLPINGTDYVEFYAWRYGGSSSFGGSSALSQASGFLVRHAGYRRHGDGVT